MLISTRQLFFSYPILARLNSCQLPIGLAVRLRLLLVHMAPRYEVINAMKSAIVGHYSTVAPDGSATVEADKREAFTAAMDELFSAAVEVALPEHLTLEQIESVPGFELGETERELLKQWVVQDVACK